MIWRPLSKFLVNDVITFAKKKQQQKQKKEKRKIGRQAWMRRRRGSENSVAGHTTYTWHFGHVARQPDRSYAHICSPWHLSWLLANLHTFTLWFNARENRMPSYRNRRKKKNKFLAKIFWHFSATSSWLIARVLLFWKNPKKKDPSS